MEKVLNKICIPDITKLVMDFANPWQEKYDDVMIELDMRFIDIQLIGTYGAIFDSDDEEITVYKLPFIQYLPNDYIIPTLEELKHRNKSTFL
jgi:hypothetical protein